MLMKQARMPAGPSWILLETHEYNTVKNGKKQAIITMYLGITEQAYLWKLKIKTISEQKCVYRMDCYSSNNIKIKGFKSIGLWFVNRKSENILTYHFILSYNHELQIKRSVSNLIVSFSIVLYCHFQTYNCHNIINAAYRIKLQYWLVSISPNMYYPIIT